MCLQPEHFFKFGMSLERKTLLKKIMFTKKKANKQSKSNLQSTIIASLPFDILEDNLDKWPFLSTDDIARFVLDGGHLIRK